MRLSSSDLLVAFDAARVLSLMSHWEWLVDPPPTEIVAVTVLGDVFYRIHGSIHFLNTSGVPKGFSLVGSAPEFETAKETPDFHRAYLCPQLAGDLLSISGRLSAGQCYSCVDYFHSSEDPDNYEATDLGQHLTISGILNCLRNRLPDNEPVDLRTLKNERRRFARLLREAYPRIRAEQSRC